MIIIKMFSKNWRLDADTTITADSVLHKLTDGGYSVEEITRILFNLFYEEIN